MLDLEAQGVARTVRATVPLEDLQGNDYEGVLVQDSAYVTLVAMRYREDELWRDPLWLCPLIELESPYPTLFLRFL